MNPPDDEDLLPTRRSLLTRLKDLGDQDGWREFFETYWRLVYGVARRAGLSDSEAQDIVQETMIVLSKHLPEFRYDPALGSFRSWLHTVVRSRLSEHFRRRNRPVNRMTVSDPPPRDDGEGDALEHPRIADDGDFEELWRTEWEQHLLSTALRRVRSKVSARQYLIFTLSAVKAVPAAVIRRKLDVNIAQIYLARHRVGRLVKDEVTRLRREADGTRA